MKNRVPTLDEFVNEQKNINEAMKAHAFTDNGKTFVDTDCVQLAQTGIKDSKLVHAGMGDFFLETPDGTIYFNRVNKSITGFNGRSHDASDNRDGKLLQTLISNLKDKNKLDTINESLNEGQFSWFTQDTHQQIGNERGNKMQVYMIDNEGNIYPENDYDGYGVFGKKDFYELVATMNGYKPDRDLGIKVAFNKIKSKTSRKPLFPALVADKKFNWKKHDFTQEPPYDPNQGWRTPDEDDYDDDDQRW